MPKRKKIINFVETVFFRNLVTAIIILNAITLGLETSKSLSADVRTFLFIADKAFLTFFVAEISLKIFAYEKKFFDSGWNLFDLVIVLISVGAGPFSVMRAFRVLRVLRMMSVVPQMRLVISALLYAVPGMTSILAVLLIIFYVAAVLSTQLFGAHPDAHLQELFGTVSNSFFTLFQLMTLEGWVERVALPTMQFFPYSWIFFISFIVITSFSVLNLFIGIIVDSMQTMHQLPAQEEMIDEMEAATKDCIDSLKEDIQKDIRRLERKVTSLKDVLDKDA